MTADLTVQGLTIGPGDGPPVLDDVHLELPAGSTLGVVGASGSGKSTLGLALAGRIRPGLLHRAGAVLVAGQATGTGRPGSRAVRCMPQDAAAALTPTRGAGSLLAEMHRLARRTTPVAGLPPAGRRDRRATDDPVGDSLAMVGLPTGREFRRRRPHQLSGGQCQRLLLALTLVGAPAVVVLDEPTSGVDSSRTDDLLALICALRAESGFSLVLISHDLAAVGSCVGRLLVMDAGRVAEQGPASEVLAAPRSPAGRALLSAARVVRTAPRRAGPGEAALHLEDLTVSVGRGRHRRAVLSGARLTVGRGQCVGLLGPSGSGKSTLARAVLGLHPWDTGEVVVAGAALAPSLAGRPAVERRRVGYVFQDSYGSLNPRRAAADGIHRAVLLSGGDPVDRVPRLLAAVGLDEATAARRPGELSGGQRQRICLARALATDPVLLICDEVTSALDTVAARSVCRLLADLVSRGRFGLLFISHDERAVAQVADATVRLADTRLVAADV